MSKLDELRRRATRRKRAPFRNVVSQHRHGGHVLSVRVALVGHDAGNGVGHRVQRAAPYLRGGTMSELDELKAKAAALDAEIEAKHAEVDAVWDEIRRLTPPTPIVTHAATGTVVSPEIEALRRRVEQLEAAATDDDDDTDALAELARYQAQAYENERVYERERKRAEKAEQQLAAIRENGECFHCGSNDISRDHWERCPNHPARAKLADAEQERDKWRASAFAVEQEKRRERQRAESAEELLRIAKEALHNIATKEYTRWPTDGDELDASDVAHDALAHLDTPASPPARPRPGVITGSSRQDGPLESPAEVSKRLASEFVNSARAALAPTPAYTLENGLIFGPDGDSFATVDAIREHDAALLVHFANKAYTLTEYEQRRDAPPPALAGFTLPTPFFVDALVAQLQLENQQSRLHPAAESDTE